MSTQKDTDEGSQPSLCYGETLFKIKDLGRILMMKNSQIILNIQARAFFHRSYTNGSRVVSFILV